MAREEVNIIIRARDASSAAFKSARSHLRNLTNTAKTVAKSFALVAAAAVGSVAALQRFAVRGGEVISVARAFNRATGADGVKALQQLREATHGLIGNYELMTGYNKALTLGAVDNVEQFGELAKTAITLGRAMGIDAGYALESLNTGIARQSRLFLDNIGIVMSVADANKRFAESIGKSVSQLTDEEKRLAFRTEALRQARVAVAQLGGITETAADAAVRFWESLKNVKDQLMAIVAQSPFVEAFFNQLSGFVEGFARVLIEGDIDKIKALFYDLGVVAANAFALAFAEAYQALPGVGRLGQKLMERVVEAATANLEGAIEEIRYLFEIAKELPGLPGGGAPGGTRGGGGAAAARGPGVGYPSLAYRYGQGFYPGTSVMDQIAGNLPATFMSAWDKARIKNKLDAFKTSLQQQADAAEFARLQTENMATTVIQAFGAMAQSGQSMLQKLIGGATSIAAAIPGVGPIGAAAIMIGGSILQSLVSRGPTPVLIDDYSSRALSKQRTLVEPINFTAIIEQGGIEVDRIYQRIHRLESRTGMWRIVPGAAA